MYAPLCDIGMRQALGERERQEDSVLLFPEGNAARLLVLSDGMGGAAGGDVASRLIVRSMARMFDGEVGSNEGNPARVLQEGARLANRTIRQAVKADPDLEGMGGTLVAVVLLEGGFLYFSMGDSPMWLVRDGRIERINSNHSIGGLLDAAVARGEMTDEAARSQKNRNSITSVIMGEPIETMRRDECVDIVPAGRGDMLILASDGIETLAEDQILQICLEGGDAGSLAAALVNAVGAVGRRRQDNTSVIVARW